MHERTILWQVLVEEVSNYIGYLASILDLGYCTEPWPSGYQHHCSIIERSNCGLSLLIVQLNVASSILLLVYYFLRLIKKNKNSVINFLDSWYEWGSFHMHCSPSIYMYMYIQTCATCMWWSWPVTNYTWYNYPHEW